MSIQSRVQDALLLWENGRLEGAFLNVLLAADATAKRKYPEMDKVGERFRRFLTEASQTRISVEYRGECQPIEDLLYKWFRCEVAHAGGLPVDIEFMSDAEQGTRSVRAGGAPEFVLKLSRGWFNFLVQAVENEPANPDRLQG
jgi:hypothetical protein